MNYEKIYYDLCNYCKNVAVVDRLKARNKNDYRLSAKVIYTERHHIVPKHCGGGNELDNLVDLLPEEHYMAHLIRWKAFKDRNDFLSVRFIVNGVSNKQNVKDSMDERTYSSLIRRISFWKQHIYEFRKTSSWHTPDGLKSISESRLGKMACYDCVTNEYVGTHPTNHENVINGNWVHHSKGMVSVTNKFTNERLYIPKGEYDPDQHIRNLSDQVGSKNSNYKELTDEVKDILFGCLAESVVDGYVLQKKFLMLMKERTNHIYKKISMAFIINKFGSFLNFVELYNSANDTNVKFNPKHRRKSSYDKAEKFFWYTNGFDDIQVKESELKNFLKSNIGFYRGRNKCKQI